MTNSAPHCPGPHLARGVAGTPPITRWRSRDHHPTRPKYPRASCRPRGPRGAVVAASIVLVAATPAEDADARTAANRSRTGQLPYGELISDRSPARDAAVQARADRVRRPRRSCGAAEAERDRRRGRAARVAAEQAAAARVEAERAAAVSSMGGGWAALRRCESGGDYGAVSANGSYRGAYQFSRSTWNSVAARSHPHLVGVDPAAAAPADQDAMALRCTAPRGRAPGRTAADTSDACAARQAGASLAVDAVPVAVAVPVVLGIHARRRRVRTRSRPPRGTTRNGGRRRPRCSARSVDGRRARPTDVRRRVRHVRGHVGRLSRVAPVAVPAVVAGDRLGR